jgi:hypothetical protein
MTTVVGNIVVDQGNVVGERLECHETKMRLPNKSRDDRQ